MPPHVTEFVHTFFIFPNKNLRWKLVLYCPWYWGTFGAKWTNTIMSSPGLHITQESGARVNTKLLLECLGPPALRPGRMRRSGQEWDDCDSHVGVIIVVIEQQRIWPWCAHQERLLGNFPCLPRAALGPGQALDAAGHWPLTALGILASCDPSP